MITAYNMSAIVNTEVGINEQEKEMLESMAQKNKNIMLNMENKLSVESMLFDALHETRVPGAFGG